MVGRSFRVRLSVVVTLLAGVAVIAVAGVCWLLLRTQMFAEMDKPTVLVTASALCLAGVAFGAWWVAGRALRPLKRVSGVARAIDGGHLNQRIQSTKHDYREFAELIDSLNGMMERLDLSFQHAHRFTQDASHELKTPIALLQAEIDQALLHETDLVQTRSLLRLSGEISRLKRITEALLFLSKAEVGKLALARERVDLTQEVEMLCEDAVLLCKGADLEFEKTVGTGLFIQADQVLLRQAAQNLLSNAVKYNRPGGKVTCLLCKSGEEAWLEIGNTGPGIPLEKVDSIFDRFRRVERVSDAAGEGVGSSGLGLNLAHEIAVAHGGTLSLISGETNAVLFRLSLPLSQLC